MDNTVSHTGVGELHKPIPVSTYETLGPLFYMC